MKPSIVFLCPSTPAFSGNGLAMRAAHNLRALSEKFSVHLLIVALYGGLDEKPSDQVLSCCASWRRLDASAPRATNLGWSFRRWLRWGRGRTPDEWKGWRAEHEEELRAYFKETLCVRLWVFRFYLLPWAKAWLDRSGQAWLDLDELESAARERQAGVLCHAGQKEEAERLGKEVKKYRGLERRFLSRFRRIITASGVETTRLRREMGLLSVETWPNIVVPPPAGLIEGKKEDAQRRLLFVGSFGHFPNREAIRHAAGEVLPRLQKLIEAPVVLSVAGAGADAHRAAFGDLGQLEWLGTVPELAPIYVQADIVVVPLGGGGGTRIKILEAFAHRKAVVSTRIGAEGLEVFHEQELLLADTPDEFAAACAALLKDPARRERLAKAGYDYVATRHGEENLRSKVAVLRGEINPSSEA